MNVLHVIGAIPAALLTVPFTTSLFAARRPYLVVSALVIACGLWSQGWFPGELLAGYLATLAIGAGAHLAWGLLRIYKRRAAALSGTVVPAPAGRIPAYTGGARERHYETASAHHEPTTDVQMDKRTNVHSPAAPPPALGLRWMVHELTEHAERVGREAAATPQRSPGAHRALALLAAACGELDAWAADLAAADVATESTRGGAR